MHQHLDVFTNRLAWSLSRYVQMQNHSYTNSLLETEAPCSHVTYWDHYDLENRAHIMQRLDLFMSCIDQHQENTGFILPEDALVPELLAAVTEFSKTTPVNRFKPVDPAKVLGINNGAFKLDTDVLQTYVVATDMAFSKSIKLSRVTKDLRPFWGEQKLSLHEVMRGTLAAHALA